MEKEMYQITYSYRDYSSGFYSYSSKAVFETREAAEAAAMQLWYEISTDQDRLLSHEIHQLYWYK